MSGQSSEEKLASPPDTVNQGGLFDMVPQVLILYAYGIDGFIFMKGCVTADED
jgi:hypothetical protein